MMMVVVAQGGSAYYSVLDAVTSNFIGHMGTGLPVEPECPDAPTTAITSAAAGRSEGGRGGWRHPFVFAPLAAGEPPRAWKKGPRRRSQPCHAHFPAAMLWHDNKTPRRRSLFACPHQPARPPTRSPKLPSARPKSHLRQLELCAPGTPVGGAAVSSLFICTSPVARHPTRSLPSTIASRLCRSRRV